MNKNYINIYNNLIKLTTNKDLYQHLKKQDTFSDRLTFLLLHFAFFLKAFKDPANKDTLQEIYDYIFRQLELSIREIGYGDQTINKKMKNYLNLFHSIINDLDNWNTITKEKKIKLFSKIIDYEINNDFLIDYFDFYYQNLSKYNLKFYIKSVSNP